MADRYLATKQLWLSWLSNK